MDLRPILIKTHNIKKLYKELSDVTKLPISVMDVKEVIEKSCGHQIQLHELDWASKRIKGELHRYKYNSNIYVATEQYITNCERRFISTKEMVHIAIDTPDSFTRDIIKLTEEIIVPGTSLIWGSTADIQSEKLAELAAMEILFPWELRENAIRELATKEKTAFEIANQFKIPKEKMLWILGRGVHEKIKVTHSVLKDSLPPIFNAS